VFYQVGITDAEREKPQRLLVTVDMNYDTSAAEMSDRIEKTVNYFDVAQDIIKFGERRNWKLLEKLAANIADLIMVKHKPQSVSVEVKKFPLPQARYVSVAVTRARPRS
jgi:FolB domain-containing protein